MSTKRKSIVIGIIGLLILIIYVEYKTAFLEIYLSARFRGSEKNKGIALTFDDCPAEPFTSQILDILKGNNVKATFFLIGARAKTEPEVVKRMVEEKHAIGNHGYEDAAAPFLFRDPTHTASGIVKTQEIIEQIIGERPVLFRPPRGRPRRDIYNVIKEEEMETIFGLVFCYRERELSPDQIVQQVANNIKNGNIVILHGDHSAVVSALPDIISTIKQKGFIFATIPDLSREKEVPASSSIFYPLRKILSFEIEKNYVKICPPELETYYDVCSGAEMTFRTVAMSFRT